MAGPRIAQNRPQMNDNLRTQNFQPGNFNQNQNGVQGLNQTGKADGVEGGKDAIFQKLEELLTKFLEAMKQGCAGCGGGEGGAKGAGGAPEGGAPQGAGGAPQGAGGAPQAGGQNDPMMLLEELLKQLRGMAQQNPQALQQFLQQNPQLAQMIGAQMNTMGGNAAPAVQGPGLVA